MISTCNKPSAESKVIENIETLATSLRIKIINFLKINCTRWRESWCPDEAWTTTTEAGPPAKDMESFLEVLDRPKRWLCGLGLTATALHHKCTIVIWQFNGSAAETYDQTKWTRSAIIRGTRGSDDGRHPVIPIVLDNGHYYCLRLPPLKQKWPRDWIKLQKEADKDITVTQELTHEVSAICRGGGDHELLQTPGASEDFFC